MHRLSLAGLFVVIGVADAQATSLTQDCSGTEFLVSAAAVTGLAVFDIATAPSSARRYNRRHMVFVPHVDPRHRSYGLSVSLSFGRSPPGGAGFVAPTWKSPGTALALSLGSTAGPMLAGVGLSNGYLFLGGLVIGPSVGHFYAGQLGRGFATVGLRGIGTVVGLYSLAGCFS
jgi:hypothetical protein